MKQKNDIRFISEVYVIGNEAHYPVNGILSSLNKNKTTHGSGFSSTTYI